MNFLDEHIGKIVAGGISLLSAGFVWLVRTVFTNNKKVDLLKQELEYKREEDAKHFDRLQSSIITIEKQNDVALNNQQRLIEVLLRRFERQEDEEANRKQRNS